MHVTDYYGIPKPVPFLDVDVTKDKPMFVDPRAIRLSRQPQPFAGQAVNCMETFFHAISSCVVTGQPADARRGLDLLQHFEEPWETRLGYAEEGFSGHGGADEVGEWIWQAMKTDARALVDVGILTQIEDLPLFVEGVAEDITSDLTTRVIFEPLAAFTADMLARYPQFTAGNHEKQKVARQVWDPVAAKWTTADVELPIADGKALLLVPRGWARPTLLMNAGRFYDTSLLSYAQSEQSSITPNRRVLKPTKDALRKQEALTRGRATILKVTLRAYDNGEDLLRVFKSFVDSRYEPVPDARIARKLR